MKACKHETEYRKVNVQCSFIGTDSNVHVYKTKFRCTKPYFQAHLFEFDTPSWYASVKSRYSTACVCTGKRMTLRVSSLIVASSHIWLWLIWGLTATHSKDTYNGSSWQDYEGCESTQLNGVGSSRWSSSLPWAFRLLQSLSVTPYCGPRKEPYVAIVWRYRLSSGLL